MSRSGLRICGLILLAGLAAGAGMTPSAARPESGVPALPGETRCPTPLLDREPPALPWTEQEHWVWERVCLGWRAKLGDRYDPDLGDEVRNNPKKHHLWSDYRILTPDFIETILLHEPYRSALRRKGVRIVGALFGSRVDLRGAKIQRELRLEHSFFKKGLEFSRARFDDVLSLVGSKVAGTLEMTHLAVRGSLLMYGAAEFNNVNLLSAKIGRGIAMYGSRFNGKLNMDAVQVDTLLLMRDGAVFNKVDLRGAKIGDQIDMRGSEFRGKLTMDGMNVAGHLLMGGYADDGGVKPAVFSQVELPFSRIGGNLVLWGARLGKFDITGTRILGEMRLASAEGRPPAQWKTTGRLILKNAHVEKLIDHPDAWPENLDLTDFTYTSLGGFDGPREGVLKVRQADWFVKQWLKKSPYSPQPYQQLAGVVRRMGHPGKADDILFHGRKRALLESGTTLYGKILQGSMLAFIGFGHRPYYALPWIVLFVFIGASIVRRTSSGKKHGLTHGWSYSLDMLLPIIKLREMHYDIGFAGSDAYARYYFYFHKLMGYVLASFLIAGLSGLTK